MNKINWKQKLSSRKLWVAVAGFITALLIAFNVDEMTIAQITGVISAFGVLVAYIIGEGVADNGRIVIEQTKAQDDDEK